MLQIRCLLNGPIQENCYLLHAQGQKECIVIDPGSSPDELRAAIDAAGLHPALLLATHCHFDHVGAVHALAEAYQAPFACHASDLKGLEELEDTYAFYGMGSTKKPKVSRTIEDSEVLEVPGIRLKALHTPGHTPGGLCFYEATSAALFSGDTLFQDSIGRSDFPGGDPEQLLRSIKTRLLSLPPETKVYPGHGEATTIAHEATGNPFLR
jgi:hydroxyacylglutathione hydrolase